MKKLISLFVVFLVVLLFPSCGDGPSHTNYINENGNFVSEDLSSKTIFYETLPATLEYNGNTIDLIDVSPYQLCSNYNYTLFLVITLDVSSLSDQQLHWLQNEDLHVHSFISHEKNECDLSTAPYLGSLLLSDEDKLIVVLTSSFFDKYRYSFEGADISISIMVDLEEKYERKNSNGDIYENHKTNGLHYSFILPEDIPDAEKDIDEPLYGYIAEWLYNKADSYK